MSGAPPPSVDPPKYDLGANYPPVAAQPAGYPPQAPPPYGPPPPGVGQPPYPQYPQGPNQPGSYQQSAPPPGPYPAQPQATHTTTVVVGQPAMGPRPGSMIRYMQSPALIVCQHCQATVTTSIEYDVGLLTWAIAGGMCIVGCWLGCCLIPFCVDATKDVEHRCPNCRQIVGRFRHFS